MLPSFLDVMSFPFCFALIKGGFYDTSPCSVSEEVEGRSRERVGDVPACRNDSFARS